MNILYIDHYAGSIEMGMEFRPYYLSKDWVNMGNKVTVIAGDYSHLRKNNPTVKDNFQTELIDGIEYVWIKTGKYEGNGVQRALSIEKFVRKLYCNAKLIAQRWSPDIVIASSTYPLDAYPAHRIAKLAKAKYVHEVHDMWPITPIELYGMSPKNPFIMAIQAAENFFCKHADLVVSVLPNAKDYFVEHGMRPEKFVFIPNGINIDDWNNPQPLPIELFKAIESAKKQSRLVISFFGSHTRAYSLDTLLQAAALVEKDKIFLVFVGEGNYKPELQKLAESLELGGAHLFFDPIDKKAIPSLLNITDVSYIGAKNNKMFKYGLGMNKIYDAMMGGKPLLYAVNAPNNYVKQYNCGVSVNSEDRFDLAEGIKQLLDMPDFERTTLGSNAKKAVLQNYTYEIISSKFIDAMKIEEVFKTE